MKKITLIILIRITKLLTPKRTRFVLILGHMRSGSSLMAHILMNSPEVCGLGETNAVYEKKEDLWKLYLKCIIHKPSLFFSKRLILDQINHNHKLPDTSWLDNDNISLIILKRKPHHAINSILKLSEQYYNASWDKEKAEDYYIDRLHYLKLVREKYINKTITIDYDEFVANPVQFLSKIQTLLNLKERPSEVYKTFSFTGQSGDPSKMIHKEHVIPDKEKYQKIEEESVSSETWRVYNNFIKETNTV